jgi:hypothetical protein
MRNIFAHDYDTIKTNRLWDTITGDLPALREECLRILTDLGYEYSPEDDNDEPLFEGEDDPEDEI